MMNKRRLGCISLALILMLGCFAGCGQPETPGPDPGPGTTPGGETPPATNFTVTFDVGEEARAAGIATPSAQVVSSGSTAVEPTVDYWEGHDLEGWYKSGVEWHFSSDKVTENMTLTASWSTVQTVDVAGEYEKKLKDGEFDWVKPGHLYVHYLRAADSASEHDTVNPSAADHYDQPIDSAVYGDWGIWVWNYKPVSGEGRAFYPARLDDSGAVYDIELGATYNDAGWDSEAKENKGMTTTFGGSTMLGIQIFSQDSRINLEGFWVNDGGDNYVDLDACKRTDGSYHWFIRQGEVQDGTPEYESVVFFDPYEGLEPGSAITQYDVVSNQGYNDVYTQQPVAEGWENNSVGYEIFVASFADSDGDGMGDLKGITQKLGALKELGVDTLWLTPFQQSNSYHGYDIRDYFTVDPRFGTLADYRELLTEAHKKGMKVLMDFVLNHTSTSNPWFVKSQKLVKETVQMPDGTKKVIDYRNFYTWTNEDKVPKTGLAAKQWFKDPNGYYYFSSFNSSMPELNFDYQAVRDAILQVALYWMSFGLDGFRLDAVKHIYMENENPNHSNYIIKDISDGTAEPGATAGDYSIDVKKANHFFLEFNAKLKATYPNALLVGENFNGDPIHIAALYPGLDSQLNFNWYYDTTGSLGTLARAENEQALRQYNNKLMAQYRATQLDFSFYRTDYIDSVFTSNHDVQRARERVLSYWSTSNKKADWKNDGVTTPVDVELSGKLAKIYGALCLSMPGITWIYQGDELGMFGRKMENNDGKGGGHEDRWLRQPFKWSKEGVEATTQGKNYGMTFGGDGTCHYLIGFNDYYMTWDENNMTLDGLAEQKLDQNSIYNTYKTMIGLRTDPEYFADFRSGKISNRTALFTAEGGGSTVLSFQIQGAKHTFQVYINASPAAQTVAADTRPVPGSTLKYSTSGKALTDTGSIDAFTYMIYLVK